MRLPSLVACLSATVSLYAVACRSDNNTTPTDGQGSNGSGSGNFVKIQQVQDDAMAPGTAVNLHDVVVTAIDNFGGKVGDVWVEEKEGGKRSGVHVFKAASSDVAMLSVGDEVDVLNATKSEFALTGSNADPSGRTVTELQPPTKTDVITIKKLGMSTTITPDKVDALAIGQMYDSTMAATGGGTAFTNAWEDWEGVLIETDNVAAQGAPKSFGSTMPPPADNWSFGITGVAKVEGSLADITMSSIARTTCFGTMVGVVDYFYDYLVLPRSTSDFATGGNGCPAAEAVCNDNIDNDGNGFTDCKDNGCIIGDATCRSAATIAALDAAADAAPANPTLPAGGLKISGACVAGISGNNLYLSAAGTGAADGGIYNFNSGTTLPAGLAVGNLVDVIGTAAAFKSSSTSAEAQLELNGLQVTTATGSCTVMPGTPGMTLAQMTTDATGHPWVGSLVTLTGSGATNQFKLTTVPASGFGQITQNATVVTFGTSMLTNPPTFTANTCATSLTGFWTYFTGGTGKYEFILTQNPTFGTCS